MNRYSYNGPEDEDDDEPVYGSYKWLEQEYDDAMNGDRSGDNDPSPD